MRSFFMTESLFIFGNGLRRSIDPDYFDLKTGLKCAWDNAKLTNADKQLILQSINKSRQTVPTLLAQQSQRHNLLVGCTDLAQQKAEARSLLKVSPLLVTIMALKNPAILRWYRYGVQKKITHHTTWSPTQIFDRIGWTFFTFILNCNEGLGVIDLWTCVGWSVGVMPPAHLGCDVMWLLVSRLQKLTLISKFWFKRDAFLALSLILMGVLRVWGAHAGL